MLTAQKEVLLELLTENTLERLFPNLMSEEAFREVNKNNIDSYS